VKSLFPIGAQHLERRETASPSFDRSLGQHLARLWFAAAAVVSALMVVLTLYRASFEADLNPAIHAVLLRFSLTGENNVGALWSGLLMLVVGVHAFDGWKLHKQDRPSLAAGWLSLALIMVIFSLDEIGSLHERVNLLSDDTWIELVPFAMVLIALYAHMSIAFLKHQDHQKLWIWITGAFVLFASVALQEYVAHRIPWPDSWKPIRTSAEEGSELVASLLLLWITMRNSTQLFGGPEIRSGPALDATIDLRVYLLVFGVVAAPALAVFTAALPDQFRGHPSDWFAAAVFTISALLAVRYWILSRRSSVAFAILAAACCFGALCTTVDPQNSIDIVSITVSKRLLALLVATMVALGMWWVISLRELKSTATTAVIFFGLFAVYFASNTSLTFSYLLPECIALAVFWVISSRQPTRSLTL
jgi:hypothetical protein